MKLAIIGTGKIAREALSVLSGIASIEVCAIFCRPHSLDTARALAQEYGIDEVYSDYGRLFRESACDTVYIALVNSAHYQYALEALQSGRHVILEKPFTVTYGQTEALISLAREKQLFLFEAATPLHGMLLNGMRRVLPDLGSIRMVQASFCQYSGRYDAYRNGTVTPTFDPVFSGGALYDLNVYNLYYCIGLFSRPREVIYHPVRGFNGVDTAGTLVLQYEGFHAILTATKDSDGPCFLSVQGEDGTIYMEGKPNAAASFSVTPSGNVRPCESTVFAPPAPAHRMTQEFEDFSDILARGDHAAADALLSLTADVMWVLDRAGICLAEAESH